MDPRPGKIRTNKPIFSKSPGSVSAPMDIFRGQKQSEVNIQKIIYGVHLGPILFNAGLSPKGTFNFESMRFMRFLWRDLFKSVQFGRMYVYSHSYLDSCINPFQIF